MSRRALTASGLTGGLALSAAGLLVGLAAAPALAAGDTAISAPPAGGTAGPLGWTGTIPIGSNPTSVCPTTGAVDTHTVTWTGPADPLTTRSSFTVSISWTPSNPAGSATANDEVLSIADATGTVLASSDGSDPSESVTLTDAKSGTYTVIACGYVNMTAQPYSGTVTATSSAVTHAPAPVAETTGGTTGGTTAGAALPEVAVAVTLPLVALGAGGLVLRRRRTG